MFKRSYLLSLILICLVVSLILISCSNSENTNSNGSAATKASQLIKPAPSQVTTTTKQVITTTKRATTTTTRVTTTTRKPITTTTSTTTTTTSTTTTLANSVIPKANAVWVYSTSSGDNAEAKQYIESIFGNNDAYLYVESGAIEINTNENYATFYFCDIYNRCFIDLDYFNSINSHYKLYPIISTDANSREAIKTISKDKLDKMVSDFADYVNSKTYIKGVHFDIEPLTPEFISLIKEIKLKTKKPISIAISQPSEASLVSFSDIIVFMNYDLCVDPSSFANSFKVRADSFFDYCDSNNLKCQLGIPLIQTACEVDSSAYPFFNYFNTSYTLAKTYSSRSSFYGISYFGINSRDNKLPSQEIVSEISQS